MQTSRFVQGTVFVVLLVLCVTHVGMGLIYLDWFRPLLAGSLGLALAVALLAGIHFIPAL